MQTTNSVSGLEIKIPDSLISFSGELSELLKLVECYYQEQHLGYEGVARFLGEDIDEQTIANVINGLERLIIMNDQLKHALAWLVVDVVYLLYHRIKSSNPNLSEQEIYELMYNYIGPDSFLYVSENTIYQYVRLAEYFPPEKRPPGTKVSFCLESIALTRGALRSLSDGEGKTEESLREHLFDIVSDMVSQGTTSRVALSDRIHREIGGLDHPLLVVDGTHHRILLAVSAGDDIDLPFEGSWTARKIMKSIVAFLDSWLDEESSEADLKLSLRTGSKVLEIEAVLGLDPSRKFPVLEVKRYDETVL